MRSSALGIFKDKTIVMISHHTSTIDVLTKYINDCEPSATKIMKFKIKK